LLVNGLEVEVLVTVIGLDVTTGVVVVFVVVVLPGITSLVPAKIVLPPLYLGFVVSTGLAFLMAATVVPFALAIELRV
jgi:hypothetical protein